MQTIRIGSLEVSKVILGGNPISGFSHQSAQVDSLMLRYFTVAQTKRLLSHAESLGIDTFLGRCDRHIMRLLMEYRDEGGRIQWIAQSCPEFESIERSIQNAVTGGAAACYIHGGVMDHLFENGRLHEVPVMIEKMRAAGMPVGIAAHIPAVHRWAEKELDVDFYMCSYYNPISRAANPAGGGSISPEAYNDKDRAAMVETIAALTKPAIHYKVFAAGRSDPAVALRFVSEHLRPSDAVCIGIYDEGKPDMLREDVALLGLGAPEAAVR